MQQQKLFEKIHHSLRELESLSAALSKGEGSASDIILFKSEARHFSDLLELIETDVPQEKVEQSEEIGGNLPEKTEKSERIAPTPPENAEHGEKIDRSPPKKVEPSPPIEQVPDTHTQTSLADKFSKDARDNSLHARLKNRPVQDLTKAFELNEQVKLANYFFEGNREALKNTLKEMENSGSEDGATAALKTTLSVKKPENVSQEEYKAAQILMESAIKRRFSD